MSFLRSIWRNSSRHKKLTSSDEISTVIGDDNLQEVCSFSVKYLGSVAVQAAADETATADAIKAIFNLARAKGMKSSKTPRVSVIVSTQGIHVMDQASGNTLLDVSIYRISYCSADALHGQVFAFIVTNKDGTMECHAFLCPKRKTAQTMSITVARIFTSAYQLWQMSEMNHIVGSEATKASEAKITLIDFDAPMEMSTNWVCFDDDEDDKENVEQIHLKRFTKGNVYA